MKSVSLVIHRRRWKESNTDKPYSNEYTLTKDSARITPAMADFLKGKVEQYPVNISCVSYMFGIKPKTFHHWYKEELSGYPQSIKAGTWGDKKIKIIDESTGEVLKEKDVPIAKPANMGSNMTIDEKQIGKKMYSFPVPNPHPLNNCVDRSF